MSATANRKRRKFNFYFSLFKSRINGNSSGKLFIPVLHHLQGLVKQPPIGCLASHSCFGNPWATVCLFTALHLLGMSHVGVRPPRAPPLPLQKPSGCQLDDVFQPVPYCSEAQTGLFCRAPSQAKFRKTLGEKERQTEGKKRCGGVQFLDALQIIKVSCFSPTHSPLPQ